MLQSGAVHILILIIPAGAAGEHQCLNSLGGGTVRGENAAAGVLAADAQGAGGTDGHTSLTGPAAVPAVAGVGLAHHRIPLLVFDHGVGPAYFCAKSALGAFLIVHIQAGLLCGQTHKDRSFLNKSLVCYPPRLQRKRGGWVHIRLARLRETVALLTERAAAASCAEPYRLSASEMISLSQRRCISLNWRAADASWGF